MGNTCSASRPQPQSRPKATFRSVAERRQQQQVDSEQQLEGVMPSAEASSSQLVDPARSPSPPVGRPVATDKTAGEAAVRRERILADIEKDLQDTSSIARDLDDVSEVASVYESSDGEISLSQNPFEPRVSPRADMQLEWEDSPRTAMDNDAFGDEDFDDSPASPASPSLMQLTALTSSQRSSTPSKRSAGHSFSRSGGPGAESYPPALTLTESAGDHCHSLSDSATRALSPTRGAGVRATVNMERSVSRGSLSQSAECPRSPRVVEFAGGPDAGTPHSLSRQSSASSILVKSSGSISLHRKPADLGLDSLRSSANRLPVGVVGSPASPRLQHPTFTVQTNSQSFNLPSGTSPTTPGNSPMVVGEISMGSFAEF